VADIEKTANRLPLNMVRALTWWCQDGGIREDVENATKRGLVNRGLVTWADGPSPKLTPLGEQVREFLLAKAKAEEEAELKALADKLAAERKIRDEGYAAGVKFAEQRDGDKVENLLKQLQILVSRYPDCATVITFKEIKERSDVGVVLAQPVDDGIRLTVRQR
jgi:hypothetical protein